MKLRYLLVIPVVVWAAMQFFYFASELAGPFSVEFWPSVRFITASAVLVGAPTLLVWVVIALVRRARAKDAREREMLELMRQQAQRRG